MVPINSILYVLITVAAFAALGVVLIGVVSFAKGGDFHKRHSNNLMRLRVVFQGVAIALFILALTLALSN